jgi:hypothetical protein
MSQQPTLGEYVISADLIVRGTVIEASRLAGSQRVTALRIDKVLKRADLSTASLTSGSIVTFASDPNHGVRYAQGERVVVFLQRQVTSRPSPAQYTSPQLFGAKYRLTSFDPTGYDGLIRDLAMLHEKQDFIRQRNKLLQVLPADTHSHEPQARKYAQALLKELAELQSTYTRKLP